MRPARNSTLIYGLLLGVWVLVVAWQVEEHVRIRDAAQAGLRKRSEAIASTLGAVVRGLQFRGAVFRDRLEPVLGELVTGDTNGAASGEVVSIALLNAAGEPVASAGRPIDLQQKDILQVGEHWGLRSMTRVYSVEGAFLNPEGDTNSQAPLILEPRTNTLRGGFRNFPRREPRPDQMGTSNLLNAVNANVSGTNPVAAGEPGLPPPPPEGGFMPPSGERPDQPREGEPRPRRPFWARDLNDKQYQDMVASRELHGLVLTLSTESLQAVNLHDLWLRFVIIFFAGISAVGAGLAMRNLSKTAQLQIRLVRASEMNSHLREMNLAAAGLAHETRNPLNIIRGMAQMISKQTDTPAELREKSRAIVDETDKVTAQLNEFINYSRPREVRRSKTALNSAVNEVVRTLTHDIEEKKLHVATGGEPIAIEADEQLLRQVLFNLVLNAIQAVGAGGQIQIQARHDSATEASLEIRDDGPGVPPERRHEIFKPYFTTNQKGTGLGLAVVQQIVLAHGWEIECLANEPKGAVFRISHLKLMA
jgi:signal transduction histidine kinase